MRKSKPTMPLKLCDFMLERNRGRKMKKILYLILFFVVLTFPVGSKALELGSGDLMIFKDYAIKPTTTIAQINQQFGNPKITTSSAFGGKAYSYYDNNYSYYLFLETDASGVIRSYGAIGGGFKMSRYQEGEGMNNTFGYMTGYSINDYFGNPPQTHGAIQYNITSSVVETYWNNYLKDSKYLYDLQAHGIAAAKVQAYRDGYQGRLTQNVVREDIFYISEQLKYNNSDLYEYASNAGKTSAISLVQRSYSDSFDSYVPNPILFASKVRKHFESSDFSYLLFDIHITNENRRVGTTLTAYINPSFLTQRKTISLTGEEKNKLANVQKEAKQYMNILNEHGGNISSSDYYSEQPNYESMPLVAGKYNSYILEHATTFLNMARAGIGLHSLKLNLDIANSAQHKAALVYYNSNHNLTSGHNPEKPPELSDSFYQTAMKYGNENLYTGDQIDSIVEALNDGYGDPILCGHRYNLLDPYYTDWGVGSVGTGLQISHQSAHKFDGHLEDDTELVAWPSNGIFTTDLAYNGIGNWTARFYKNYQGTTNTTVTVHNLSTDEVFEITKNNLNVNRYLNVSSSGYTITFRDDNITYENGDVFEITLHNVQNLKTNKTEDYTYRSVFYEALSAASSIPVTDITLSKTEVVLGLSETYHLSALALPSTASNKMMTFTSSNTNIATVRQDGMITAVRSGITTITIQCGSITKTVTVKVKNADGSIPSYQKGDVNDDERIDVLDAREVLYMTVGRKKITVESLQKGDMDDNNKIEANDAVEIMRLYVGKK